MTKVINAFHKDYVKTYHPEFISKIRTESAATLNGQKYGAKNRISRESADNKHHSSITMFPKTKRVSLEPTEFHIFSKAGMPKGVK